jgi:hypothetical protein
MAASPANIGLPDLISSIIRVGDGRGFVIAAREKRYIVTAAHCLPVLPTPQEETYRDLVGQGWGGARDHGGMQVR